jgi:hypothetical protein
MGTNVVNQIDSIGKTQLFRAHATPFVVHWRAFQHELAAKANRLDFVTKISEFVATPRRNSSSSQFRKSLLSTSIA